MPTMLYKCPGPHEIHGGHFDYTIVEDDQIEATQAEGWSLTTDQAKQVNLDAMAAQDAERERLVEQEAAKAVCIDSAPPTRAELEQMATKLGLPFNGRTGDKKLLDMIRAATEANDSQPVAAQEAASSTDQAPEAAADAAPVDQAAATDAQV